MKDIFETLKEEHDKHRELLDTDLSNPHWIATFRKLVEEASHHMDEEEAETFAAGRKVIDEATAQKLARRFEEEKSKELKEQAIQL